MGNHDNIKMLNFFNNLDFDPCIPNPCFNGGACTPSADTTNFICKCHKNCQGKYCERCVSGDSYLSKCRKTFNFKGKALILC